MNQRTRPLLVTAVGVIGIVAGVFPLAEVIGILLSARFAAWFLPVMRAIVPSRDSLASTLLFGIAVADISFGIGVLARKPWALYGMILRSVIGLPIDYLNFTAGNRAGALVGLTVNVFIVWVLLRADSRKWIGHADSVA